MHGDPRRRARRRDGVAGPDALAVRPLPRLEGHVEMAHGVGNVCEKREVRRVQQPTRVRRHEEVVGLLPVTARRGARGLARAGSGLMLRS